MKASRGAFFLKTVVLCFAAILVALSAAQVCRADALEDASVTLAQKIAAALGPQQPVQIGCENHSALSSVEIARLCKKLAGELTTKGHANAAQGINVAEVRLRASESLDQVLLVAEFGTPSGTKEASARKVAMVAVPKAAIAIDADVRTDVRIEREFIFEQQEAILDFEIIPRAEGRLVLTVLEPERLAFHEKEGSGWGAGVPIAIPKHKPWPRDLRGGLRAEKDHTEFSLPGLCGEAGLATDSMGIRNVRSSCGDGEQVASLAGWGTEVAGINSRCGMRRQVLATRQGDWTMPDAIQAYEMNSDYAIAVGEAVEFAGPVMALWSSGDESYARAVVKNLKTGRYEAYKLTIVCGQ